ncbi:hypothetical protein [Mesorhizobium sp. KR2-14]|uniref:hypothetical protein n=1 Tax=Mesorhizobium sp. KR2-14 TaxID=3156610 RepID=UPI0032B488BD
MKRAAVPQPQEAVRSVDNVLMKKVFHIFAALGLVSAAISYGGNWLGRSLALAGHTDDTRRHEVVIGNNVISAPANAIRFEKARRDGIATRLDIYLRWPEMEGYTSATRDDFNNADGGRHILFLSFDERMMSRDMSGRFAPIYSSLIERPGTAGPGGLMLYGFTEKSGYINEELAVAERPGEEPFVARCLVGPSAEESLAPCERDIHLGDELSLSYRFSRELLEDWQRLEASVRAKAAQYVKTGR